MTGNHIISRLPYSAPFLFVDELEAIDENGVTGHYTFKPTEFFYQGHFINLPITPGVILTETMAQIGLVCLGIYLLRDELTDIVNPVMAFTSMEVEFLIPVLPGEKVRVTSKKKYFRFGKLKCYVEMSNSNNELVCHGTLSGIIKMKNE